MKLFSMLVILTAGILALRPVELRAASCESLFELPEQVSVASVLPSLKAQLVKDGFEFNDPVVKQALLGILTLTRELPETYGQTQTVETLFGKSSLTKERREWGLLANQKVMTKKRTADLYKSVFTVFDSLGAIQLTVEVPDKDWINGSRVGRELETLISEIEAVNSQTAKPFAEMTADHKAKRLTSNEKKEIAKNALSLPALAKQSQLMLEALQARGISQPYYLPDAAALAAVKPKNIKVSQLKAKKDGADDVVSYFVDLGGQTINFMLDGLFVETLANKGEGTPSPWAWNSAILIAESRFNRETGEFKGHRYLWQRVTVHISGMIEESSQFAATDAATILDSSEVRMAETIQGAVAEMFQRYDVVALGTDAANKRFLDRPWALRTDMAGEPSIRIGEYKLTGSGAEFTISLWRTFRMLVFEPAPGERRGEQVPVLFRLKVDSQGALAAEPAVEFVESSR